MLNRSELPNSNPTNGEVWEQIEPNTGLEVHKWQYLKKYWVSNQVYPLPINLSYPNNLKTDRLFLSLPSGSKGIILVGLNAKVRSPTTLTINSRYTLIINYYDHLRCLIGIAALLTITNPIPNFNPLNKDLYKVILDDKICFWELEIIPSGNVTEFDLIGSFCYRYINY